MNGEVADLQLNKPKPKPTDDLVDSKLDDDLVDSKLDDDLEEKLFTAEQVQKEKDAFAVSYKKQQDAKLKKREKELEIQLASDAEKKRILENDDKDEKIAFWEAEAKREKAENDAAKREREVNRLLAVNGVKDEPLRNLFLKMGDVDIAEMDAAIKANLASIDAIVDERVAAEINDRLNSDAPPKTKTKVEKKNPRDMTSDEWVAYKKANGVY